MALGLKPSNALLNDSNPHLVNFYKQVQSGLAVTIETDNAADQFYSHRERFNQLVTNGHSADAEAAQLFYYLNRTGYNGLCRFNRKGEFNVPFGRYKTITYRQDFYSYRSVFRKWTFRGGDLESVKLASGDFVYADPPYDVEFTTYSPGGFAWQDQVRTAELLAKHDGPVVLSNQATPRIVELYKQLGFKLQFLAGPRRISCTGDRSSAPEVLALNSLC